MHILHITFSLNNGGKENMLVDIANEQQKLGHNLTIVIINQDIDNNILNRLDVGIKIILFDRKSGSKSIITLLKLFYLLNISIRPQIIHSHDTYLVRILKLVSIKPIFLTAHGIGLDISHMKFYNKVFSISNAVKNDLKIRGNINSKVIYNGIYSEQIKSKDECLLKEKIKLVCVKRINHPRTGQDILVNAIEILLKGGKHKNLLVDFVGDGPTIKELQFLIDSKGIASHFNLLGNKKREWVYNNLSNYDIYIQPSLFEGFGLSIVEAMAAKIPVIASNIDGPIEILENGKYGYLFENKNSVDLATRISSLIDNYESRETNKFIIEAKQHCNANFNIRKTALNYCEAYK